MDDYAEKIGAIGVAIYTVLAWYADRQTGVCYPCIGTIAMKLKLGRTTVKKYLHPLKYDLIAITSRWDEQGDPTSNSYMLLDPSPRKWRYEGGNWKRSSPPEYGTFKLDGGRSPDDPPPCLSATDPQSPADPEQSSFLNKNNRTSLDALLPQRKNKKPVHILPLNLVFLPDNITICHHC